MCMYVHIYVVQIKYEYSLLIVINVNVSKTLHDQCKSDFTECIKSGMFRCCVVFVVSLHIIWFGGVRALILFNVNDGTQAVILFYCHQ